MAVSCVGIIRAEIPGGELTYDDVLHRALLNSSFARNLRRRQLEADYEVAKARGSMREITLFAQIGFTGTSDAFSGAYDPLKDNQVVQLGMKIPLLDEARLRWLRATVRWSRAVSGRRT